MTKISDLSTYETGGNKMNKELTKQVLNSYPNHWTEEEKYSMHEFLTSLVPEVKVLGEKVILKAEDFYNTKWDATEWTEGMKTQWQETMFELGITWWGGSNIAENLYAKYYYVVGKKLHWDDTILEFQTDKNKQRFFKDIFLNDKVSSPEFTEYDDASMKARKLFEKCLPVDDGEVFDYGEPPHYYGKFVIGVNKPLNIERYYSKPLYQTLSENGQDVKVYGEIHNQQFETLCYFIDEDCKVSMGVECFDDPYHPFVEDAVEHIDEGFEGLVYIDNAKLCDYLDPHKLSQDQLDFISEFFTFDEDIFSTDYPVLCYNSGKKWHTGVPIDGSKELSFNDIFKRAEELCEPT